MDVHVMVHRWSPMSRILDNAIIELLDINYSLTHTKYICIIHFYNYINIVLGRILSMIISYYCYHCVEFSCLTFQLSSSIFTSAYNNRRITWHCNISEITNRVHLHGIYLSRFLLQSGICVWWRHILSP